MEDAWQEMVAYVDRRKMYVEADRDFHLALLAASGNEHLACRGMRSISERGTPPLCFFLEQRGLPQSTHVAISVKRRRGAALDTKDSSPMNRLAISVAAAAATALMSGCATQSGGWATLIDGSAGMENWTNVGGANWHAQDGAIVADQRPGKDAGFLVSRQSYRDFQLHAEFWVSADANSGIYMRCSAARPLTDRTCYEANLFDQRPDPSYGTGAITNIAKVNPMPKAGGSWGTYDITVQGDRITVVLNGVKTAEARDSKLPSGPVALQYAGGIVKFRKVQIKSL